MHAGQTNEGDGQGQAEPAYALEPAAAELYLHAASCVRNFGDFHLAISAGPDQVRLVMRLMVDPAFRALPWSKAHLWVIEDTPGRADGAFAEMAEILGDHAGIPQSHLHPVPESDDPVGDYERALRETLAWREKGHDRLDYALLGLRPDSQPDGWSGGDDPDRLALARDWGAVGMTARLLRATRLIGVVATGPAVARAVGHLTERRPSRFDLIHPVGGMMRWYLDAEACP